MKKTLLGISSLFILFSLPLQAVSFDCSKAKSFSEKTICTDDGLSNRDDELKKYYEQAKTAAMDLKAFKDISRDLWNMRERCQNKSCIDSWYDQAFTIYNSFIVIDPVFRSNTNTNTNTNTNANANGISLFNDKKRTKIEDNASIFDDSANGLKLLDSAVELTLGYGFKCDSVSAFRPMITSPSNYILRCNKFRYDYAIKDIGGTWVVSIDD